MKNITLISILLLFSATSLSAKAITVTNGNDSGAGSLRQAIIDAKDGGIINFDNVATVYFAGVIIIEKKITITSDAINNTIFQDASVWTDTANKKRFFEIKENAELTLNNLTLKDHTGNCSGGAISSRGNLTINNCNFDRNRAYDVGGAIYNIGGSLTINNCSFNNNVAPTNGGAISCGSSGITTINNCFFNNNTSSNANAISNSGQISINNCKFSYDNTLSTPIVMMSGNSIKYITNCVFSNINTSSSIIDNFNTNLVIDNCVFAENQTSNIFGLINNSGTMSSYTYINSNAKFLPNGPIMTDCNILIINSIFSKNKNKNNMSLFTNSFGADATIVNCLFVENETNTPDTNADYLRFPEWQNHGIISNLNTNGWRYDAQVKKVSLTVINSTIADNIGIGLYSGGDINVYNTIIFNNIPKNEVVEKNVYTTDLPYSQNFSNNLIGENPLFNSDYSLKQGSPAIDAGNNNYLPVEITTDLLVKLRISGNTIDMGAYEYQQMSTAINSVSSEKGRNAIGYYNIMGQRLQKKPTNGLYIILYDNGTSEKVIE